MLPTLTRVGVLGNYWIQFQEYSQELCVNTDKPELSCNGKCQMMQELNHAEETPPFTSPLSISIKEQPAVISGAFLLVAIPTVIESLPNADFAIMLQRGVSNDVFHPPC